MNKLIVSSLIAATLAASGAALAQSAGDGQAALAASEELSRGPKPGSAEYYNNSGYTPPPTVYYDGRRYYTQPYANPRNQPVYPYGRTDRSTSRDRDGDGISNRRDRWPDDASRS